MSSKILATFLFIAIFLFLSLTFQVRASRLERPSRQSGLSRLFLSSKSEDNDQYAQEANKPKHFVKPYSLPILVHSDKSLDQGFGEDQNEEENRAEEEEYASSEADADSNSLYESEIDEDEEDENDEYGPDETSPETENLINEMKRAIIQDLHEKSHVQKRKMNAIKRKINAIKRKLNPIKRKMNPIKRKMNQIKRKMNPIKRAQMMNDLKHSVLDDVKRSLLEQLRQHENAANAHSSKEMRSNLNKIKREENDEIRHLSEGRSVLKSTDGHKDSGKGENQAQVLLLVPPETGASKVQKSDNTK